eukprot:2109234-Pyramimonas_sp.AAC.1
MDSPAAPPSPQGRVALHRLRSGRFDIVVTVAYFPPRPTQKREGRESTAAGSCKRSRETVD